MTAFVVLDGLALRRGGRDVLDAVSFGALAGEAVLIGGPNGSGKTTLLRAIAGLIAPAAGSIAIDGKAAAGERRRRAVYVGHADAVKPGLTAAETLSFWARLYEDGEHRIHAAVDAFALAAFLHRRSEVLSAGQRRRLALARAVLSGKAVWLLDEPAAAIDAPSLARLLAAVKTHCADGGVALIATHDRLDLPGARALRIGDA